MKYRDQTQWHPWFSWYPVKIEGRRVWLREVERRWVMEPDVDDLTSYNVRWEYRLPEPPEQARGELPPDAT
jgi:hypothetical protein